ncbi:CLUMA_CG002779, isoform A [Clunio marinus]|uniref:CLUMA_CG002779, isoform A n=1 Tax=Clunio marinus TaxID=568069 RepID=A0A1J1HLB1_9DIPT|nr:CLUMA_CG002779, isoform A [Clunio marinus]
MSGDKIQLLRSDEDDIMTSKERVYSVNRITPDPYIHCWRKQPKIHEKEMLMKLIYDQMKYQDSFDICIEIGNAIFSAILLILKSYSNFFANREFADGACIKLSESRITRDTFTDIYKWILSKRKQIDREDIIPLLLGAQYLEVELLEQQIWNLIQDCEKFQEDEAFLLYQEAKLWKCTKVQNMMIQRVQRFFMTVVCSEEFLIMEPNEVMNWLRLDSIGINMEVEVFYAAARWMLFNWNDRKVYLMDLVKLVRFGIIDPWRIVEFRMNKKMGKLEVILNNSDFQDTLESSLSYSTYRNCFNDDSHDQFNDFLKRFNFKKIYPRDQMIDPMWQEYYKQTPYTFQHFEDYLKMTLERRFHSLVYTKYQIQQEQ